MNCVSEQYSKVSAGDIAVEENNSHKLILFDEDPFFKEHQGVKPANEMNWNFDNSAVYSSDN